MGICSSRNVFKSSQDYSWVWPPSTGATLEAGFCAGRGHLVLASPPHSAPSRSDPCRHAAPSGSMPLSDKRRKSQWQEFIPSKLFTVWMAGLTAANISGMSRCLKFTSSAMDVCQHLMTQFLPDSTKKVMTRGEMSHPQKWLHICGPAPHNLRVSFPDQLNFLQPTPAKDGHWIISPSTRPTGPQVEAQANLGLLVRAEGYRMLKITTWKGCVFCSKSILSFGKRLISVLQLFYFQMRQSKGFYSTWAAHYTHI